MQCIVIVIFFPPCYSQIINSFFSEQTFFSKLERLVFAGHGTSLRCERYGDHAYIDM